MVYLNIMILLTLVLIAFGFFSCFQKAIAGNARDDLFRLRDRLREEFDKKDSLGNESYSKMRDHINIFLHGIDGISLFGIYLIYTTKVITNRMSANKNKQFWSESDPDLNKLLKDTDKDIGAIIIKYLWLSGIPTIPFVLPMIAVCYALVAKRAPKGTIFNHKNEKAFIRCEKRQLNTSIVPIVAERANFKFHGKNVAVAAC